MISRINKEKVYRIELSGFQIKLIQAMIVNSDIKDSLSELGQITADVLYKSLEDDSEELNERV